MKVLFYANACMLDVSLEFINKLKHEAQLHVLIEITPLTKKTNILNIDHLPKKPALVAAQELIDKDEFKNYAPYFEGVKSVHFVVHASRSAFSYKNLLTSRLASKFIKNLNPDVIHYEDTMSLRSVGIIKSFNACKNLHLTIHDPEHHPGEENIKTILSDMIFSSLKITKLFFYSTYSKERYYSQTNEKRPFEIIPMKPYTFFDKYKKETERKYEHILFFGRLSKYKGVDLFLRAIRIVLDHYPNIKFIIAGKASNGYVLDETIIKKHPSNIQYINRHLSNFELVDLINRAKFTVCPYLEASQSGVLMTSLAIGTPVLATKVGAFPEYIQENINGWLVPENDEKALAGKILELIYTQSFINVTENLLNLEASPKAH